MDTLNKRLYKSTLFTLKLLPIVMAVSFFMNDLCAYFQVPYQIVTHFLGITVAPLLFMYISSYVFRFCNYHRIFIHYIVLIEFLNIYDWYIGIPVSNEAICLIHIWISIIFFLIAIIMYINKRFNNDIRNS